MGLLRLCLRGCAALLLAVLLVAAFLYWRAANLPALQLVVDPAPPHGLNAQALAQRLGAAIRFATVSHADPAQVDWATFTAFRGFLAAEFPLSFSRLQVELSNTHSLLLTWPGAQPQLPPALVMAHYDVVPVTAAELPAWTHPPFAGVIAEGRIWGRGALDNKSGVLGLLEALELLLAQGLEPQRTLLLAFGHDEEVGGAQGAKFIAATLAQRYGQLALLLDEGGFVLDGSGLVPGPVAFVGTAEKGYLSLELSVQAPGGHSSQPPRETAVAILAQGLHRLQQQQFPARLAAPSSDMFAHLGPALPLGPRLLLAGDGLTRPLLLRAMSEDVLTNAMIRTTAAPTMLQGAAQDNILPSRASAVINYRLLPGDSSAAVIQQVETWLADPRVQVQPHGPVSEASPVSASDSAAFALLATQIRRHYPQALVTPYLVLGATDARHYQALAPHSFRFLPFAIDSADLAGMHGTNESLALASYAQGVAFYRDLLSALVTWDNHNTQPKHP